MRWIVCLLLVAMWLVGQFTGFSIADQPHLPLLAAAGLVLTRQRQVVPEGLDPHAPHGTPALGH